MTDEEIIAEAGRRLRKAAPGARIVLFGSHARGEADRESDLDFLVIEPEVRSRHAESVRLRRALRGLDVPADIVVVSAGQAEEWSRVEGTIIHEALKRGRELVGA